MFLFLKDWDYWKPILILTVMSDNDIFDILCKLTINKL